ncbi:hypothetical protein C1H46_013672 [Malus baccata]|uniref:Uncharacterized protein n=1 Tax=Malus baccata TaxID=106549 RepID=A0A540MR61_MALBA|nr:hypothetical protein C1H46_013672 [Malus baccata]
MPEPRSTIPLLSLPFPPVFSLPFSLSRCNIDLVGFAIVHKLQSLGFTNLALRTHTELDLTRQADVNSFLAAEKP